MEVQLPGLEKWSFPLLRNEEPPEDHGFDLGADPTELDGAPVSEVLVAQGSIGEGAE